MLSVKLVRSLVLGETISTTTPSHHHPNNNNNPNEAPPVSTQTRYSNNNNKKKKKRMPMLLFTPTRELITDTFRLASIARHLGLDFQPNSSLSHLLFSWPTPNTLNVDMGLGRAHTDNRTSVSSQTSTFTNTTASSSSTITTASFPAMGFRNDAVPIPFPCITANSSLSLLRSFVSLTKGLFKLVFVESDPGFSNYYSSLVDYDAPVDYSLVSRVSGKRVRSIDDFSTELAGRGWSLFRGNGPNTPNSVYLFRKMECNRVRVRDAAGGGGGGGGGDGECGRVRELRLPTLDFEKGINLRVLLYILLVTDDVFYLV